MKKSVYSIVLSDDVIDKIDELAYRTNTSRSNLINQILADHVSYTTPEKRYRNIFDCIREMMDNQFNIPVQGSDTLMSIRSPLKYKYKPTIRYKVELLREQKNNTFGILNVTMRTQSAILLESLEVFFCLWQQLEKKYIDKYFTGGIKAEFSDGKYIRAFKFTSITESLSPDKIGKAISDYITIIDSVMKLYFAGIETPDTTFSQMESYYKRCIKNQSIII